MRERHLLRRIITAVVIGALLCAVALLLPRWWQHVRSPPPWPVPAASLDRARAALPALPVVAPRGLDDYDRDFFGPAWADVDGNGCDTRNDVLRAWLTDPDLDPAAACVVDTGTLTDPYTGHLVDFRRGPQTSAAVQIDHVVALADAWRKGAAEWPAGLALQFANDPANMVPVDGQVNQDKQADDAASWLPPNIGFHCAYVVQQVLVKSAYGLGVSAEELGAIGEVLTGCHAAEPTAGWAGGLNRSGVILTYSLRANGTRSASTPSSPSAPSTNPAATTNTGPHHTLDAHPRPARAAPRCRRAPIASPAQAPRTHTGRRPPEQHTPRRARVPAGRHAGLQRQRPDPGPGLRVRPAQQVGREARAPPAPAG